MKKIFNIFILFFLNLCLAQDCCDAEQLAVDNCGGPGCYIPQCTLDCNWEPMQCWSSTGYCWCVDENGVEISGTSTPSWQGFPDCEEFDVVGDECVTQDGLIGFYDCELCCWDLGLFSWLGDGYCDMFGGCGWEGPQFDCYELGFDCGDYNESWDELDPLGYCEDQCLIDGDVNNDNIVNILDAVLVVECILNENCNYCTDIDQNGVVNVLDVIVVINIILDIE